MSCVCILTPVVIAAWPAFSAAVMAAATSLGYQVVSDVAAQCKQSEPKKQKNKKIRLEVPNSELVTEQLGRDQRLSVTRDGVTITFSRDERGKALLSVTGNGQDEETLRRLGEQLSQCVVQKCVYQRLMEEMRAQNFTVVEEVDEDQSIHLRVRHWAG